MCFTTLRLSFRISPLIQVPIWVSNVSRLVITPIRRVKDSEMFGDSIDSDIFIGFCKICEIFNNSQQVFQQYYTEILRFLLTFYEI